ncbi:GNAT family N-acetyltransferase [Lysinibacillus sp. BW-2-10]|uniref:GNAT family N-acetyltransferase n=1 Tax=Lysinibacillus sp. BW-2-10 TaxID=2590030 RepID=UPI0011809B60|nr:GNAT family N-acetyltransferase [Lysinibacillus sp. BW-2-10]TSI07865.1 GNAT family N-acetyltransferase [Lysinibacillus sp. BW-2-10]
MELQTERLMLIPCTEEVLHSSAPADDYEIGPHISMYITELKEDPTLTGWGVWLVIEKQTHTIIGDIGFKGKPDANHTVEIGYGIVPSAQNKGYATEAVRALIDWAFSFDHVETIVAECLEDNVASIKVLEKVQMQRTGLEMNMLKWALKKEG